MAGRGKYTDCGWYFQMKCGTLFSKYVKHTLSPPAPRGEHLRLHRLLHGSRQWEIRGSIALGHRIFRTHAPRGTPRSTAGTSDLRHAVRANTEYPAVCDRTAPHPPRLLPPRLPPLSQPLRPHHGCPEAERAELVLDRDARVSASKLVTMALKSTLQGMCMR